MTRTGSDGENNSGSYTEDVELIMAFLFFLNEGNLADVFRIGRSVYSFHPSNQLWSFSVAHT